MYTYLLQNHHPPSRAERPTVCSARRPHWCRHHSEYSLRLLAMPACQHRAPLPAFNTSATAFSLLFSAAACHIIYHAQCYSLSAGECGCSIELTCFGQRQVDPTLTRADRLVGQVLGDVGQLPDVFTELEINFFLLRRLLGVRTQVTIQLAPAVVFALVEPVVPALLGYTAHSQTGFAPLPWLCVKQQWLLRHAGW